MAKKEKADTKPLIPEPAGSKMHVLAMKLQKNHPDATTASEAARAWRYIDFCDPHTGRPCLALEWLFGARGLLVGRILNLIASYSKGKSSFMYFMYACAQRMLGGAWCCHMETEGAPAPPDFIASYGTNPADLLIGCKTSLESCMEWMDETEATVRGEWGQVKDPETGKIKKSEFTDPLDPLLTMPIIMGIDSLSSLGIEEKVQMDVADKTKTAQPGVHAKKIREYMRERVGRWHQRQLLLMMASHETKKIEMGGGMKAKGADVTSLAKDAVGIHATYEVLVQSKKWSDKNPPYVQYGDIINLYTTKNKISPRYRNLDLYLRTGKGFDLVQTDVEWFLSNADSPFVHPQMQQVFGTIKRYAGRITCPVLQAESFPTQDAFLDALYKRQDIVMGMREWLRIRGFGFKFETDYGIHTELPEPAAEAADTAVASTEAAPAAACEAPAADTIEPSGEIA